MYRSDSEIVGISFASRITGRFLIEDVVNPKTKKVVLAAGELITKEKAQDIDKNMIEKIKIRSAITCQTRRGLCQKCYVVDLGRNELVQIGQAVGIVAAQAIGEPGTQLTMRTFHI